MTQLYAPRNRTELSLHDFMSVFLSMHDSTLAELCHLSADLIRHRLRDKRSDKIYWQVAESPAKAIRKDRILQGRLRWEKKTFTLLSSFQHLQSCDNPRSIHVTYL